MRRLDYPGTRIPVLLENATALEPALDRTLVGWLPARRALPVRALRAAARPGQRRTHLRLTRAGYEGRSFYMETPMRGMGPASAICTVLADLAQDFFESRPGWLALHCGAFLTGGRLVALTGPKRAGKSTLIARLTAEPGLQVFCDDVLPVRPDGQACALGIAPRLRLPLPPAATPAFRAHARRWLGPQDGRYGYVCAPTVAPHGTLAPLSTFVLLDRRPDGPARLHHLAPDDAVHHLMAQNMADFGGAEGTFAQARRLAGELECLRLVYADVEDAAALLRRAFAVPRGVAPGVELGDALTDPAPPPPDAPPVPPDARWSRAPGVALREQGGSAFLWAPGGGTVWRLNRVAQAVWAMLGEPASARDLGALLAEVFPDVPPDRVHADVGRLIAVLAAEGFLHHPP